MANNVTAPSRGVLQFVSLVFGGIASFFPGEFDGILNRWGKSRGPADSLVQWPTDITSGVIPIACHSHNDYWRPVPLYTAIRAGCISVEADVYLFDDDLFVGHSTPSLTPTRTLRSLYINPLIEILDRQNPVNRFHPVVNNPPNGIFDTEPSQTLILLVDFKNDPEDVFSHLNIQLAPLRDRGYLTHFNGSDVVERPITVVASGDAPFDIITANDTYRDVFFDAPLADLVEKPEPFETRDSGAPGQDLWYTPDGVDIRRFPHQESPSSVAPKRPVHKPHPDLYSPLNSYYASVSYKRTVGFPWGFRVSDKQLEIIRSHVRGAHSRGLKVRYWAIPGWPHVLRNHVWTTLLREGVDVLNVDDVKAASKRDWSGKSLFGWFRS